MATDVLARGIDVEEVDYVVNYDLPTQPEDYVHRIGRTGRAGAAGFAVSFVSPETEDALRDIEKLIKRTIPEMELPSFDAKAAAEEAASKSQRADARARPGHPPSRQGAGCAREGERAMPQAGEGRLAKGESARVPEAPRQEEGPASAKRRASKERPEAAVGRTRRNASVRLAPQPPKTPSAKGQERPRQGAAPSTTEARTCGRAVRIALRSRAREDRGASAVSARSERAAASLASAFGRPSPVSFPL